MSPYSEDHGTSLVQINRHLLRSLCWIPFGPHTAGFVTISVIVKIWSDEESCNLSVI